jgi:hypothetical protein
MPFNILFISGDHPVSKENPYHDTDDTPFRFRTPP